MRRSFMMPVLAAALLYLPGAGCDLFGTRTPDDPEQGNSEWQVPTTPRIAVENLENALESGSFNDYERSLTKDFTFFPDPADVSGMETERPGQFVYLDWDAAVETTTAEALKGGQPLTLDLTFIDESLEEVGRVRRYDYVLTLVREGGDEVYRGQAWFRTRQEVTDWLIFSWEDVPEEGFTTWGRLKGRARP